MSARASRGRLPGQAQRGAAVAAAAATGEARGARRPCPAGLRRSWVLAALLGAGGMSCAQQAPSGGDGASAEAGGCLDAGAAPWADAAGPPRFLGPPQLLPGPNASTPLAATLTFAADRPVRATVRVHGGPRVQTTRFARVAACQSLTLLGFLPGRSYRIQLTITAPQAPGAATWAPLSFSAPALPADFLPLQVELSVPEKMEPGVLMMAPLTERRTQAAFIIALDSAGRVVWYHRLSWPHASLVRRLQSGNLLLLIPQNQAVELDMLGNVVARWHAAGRGQRGEPGSVAVDCDSLHHDVFEMPSGNLAWLCKELRTYKDYPSSEVRPAAPKKTANVLGDVVLETRRDGAVVGRYKLLDLVDPYRIGYNSLNNFNDNVYSDEYGETRDWSHANTVIYDRADDAFLVSLRHQDAVVKFSRATGKLLWILGTPENWKPPYRAYRLAAADPAMAWHYHQHSPRLTGQGTLLLFDNGLYRASPYDPKMSAEKSYSRVVEYAVDPARKEVSLRWVYGGPQGEAFYSPSRSDVQWMPATGNILVADGNRQTQPQLKARDPANRGWARVVELTHTSPPRKVFEVVMDDTSAEAKDLCMRFAFKAPSLYPPAAVR